MVGFNRKQNISPIIKSILNAIKLDTAHEIADAIFGGHHMRYERLTLSTFLSLRRQINGAAMI